MRGLRTCNLGDCIWSTSIPSLMLCFRSYLRGCEDMLMQVLVLGKGLLGYCYAWDMMAVTMLAAATKDKGV